MHCDVPGIADRFNILTDEMFRSQIGTMGERQPHKCSSPCILSRLMGTLISMHGIPNELTVFACDRNKPSLCK